MSDDLIRLVALNRVRELRELWGDAIPESEPAKGVAYGDDVVLLKGPQGIFKPRQLTDGPLTIMSTLGSRYDRSIVRIKSDYTITVENDTIDVADAFARVSLSEFDGRRIVLPAESAHHPGPDWLD